MIRYLYRCFGIMFVVLIIIIYMICATSFAPQYIVSLFNRLGYPIKVEGLNGTLISGLQVKNLEFSNPSLHLKIQQATLQIEPWHLIRKKLFLNLVVSKLHLNLNENSHEQAKEKTDTKLPVVLDYLDYSIIEIHEFVIAKNQLEIVKGHLEILKGSDKRNYLSLMTNKAQLFGVFNYQMQNPSWNLNAHVAHLNLNLISPHLTSDLSFPLNSHGVWNKTIKKLSIESAITGILQGYALKGSISIDISGNSYKLNTLLNWHNAYLNVAGVLNNEWNMRWDAHIPSLSALLPSASGSIVSKGTLLGSRFKPNLSGRLAVEQLRIGNFALSQLQGDVKTIIQYPKVDIDLAVALRNLKYTDYVLKQINTKVAMQLNQGALLSAFNMNFPEGNVIQGKIQLPQFSFRLDQPLNAAIHLHFSNLAKLVKIPEFKITQGNIGGVLNLTGKINTPILTGHLSLNDGMFSMPTLGTEINHLFIQSTLQDKKMSFSGQFESQGQARIKGILDFNNKVNPLSVSLIGQNLKLIALPQYQVLISPKLELSYDFSLLKLDGLISIPYAELKPKNFSNMAILPKEATIINHTKSKTMPLALNFKLKIELGDHVFLNYDNLTTFLKGQAIITGANGRELTASGEFYTAKGFYQAYGKKLKIKTGRLIYAGNELDNPGLDILALEKISLVGLSDESTVIDTLKVGVSVKGSLREPVLTLYSEPLKLSQNDILSYMVFGKPQSQISKQSSTEILALASALYSGNGGGGITTKLQNKLGLSELNVGATTIYDPNTQTSSSKTTVTAGKKLSEKLSVHYSVGLFDPVQVFNLKYQFNKHFAFQTATSPIENGADLFYEIETD